MGPGSSVVGAQAAAVKVEEVMAMAAGVADPEHARWRDAQGTTKSTWTNIRAVRHYAKHAEVANANPAAGWASAPCGCLNNGSQFVFALHGAPAASRVLTLPTQFE